MYKKNTSYSIQFTPTRIKNKNINDLNLFKLVEDFNNYLNCLSNFQICLIINIL